MDQNKKTLRQFQCRDYLWEIFEQMSGELECSVDYLVNEAMRQYARSRNYGSKADPAPTGAGGGGPPSFGSVAPPAFGAAAPPPAFGAPRGGSLPPPPTRGPAIPSAPPARPGPAASPGLGPTPGGLGHPPPPRAGASSPGNLPAPPGFAGPPSGAATLAGRQGPPPLANGGGFGGPPPLARPPAGAAAGGALSPPLFVIFNGQKFPVNKEEFIIGRGSKSADLAIKDGNISRRHAAVIYQNGGYYMKDLGSTNGVEHQGRRVDGRRIEEGDVYTLCDYEIRFTYR